MLLPILLAKGLGSNKSAIPSKSPENPSDSGTALSYRSERGWMIAPEMLSARLWAFLHSVGCCPHAELLLASLPLVCMGGKKWLVVEGHISVHLSVPAKHPI